VTAVSRNRVLGLAAALAIFIVDQAVKLWVRDGLRLNETRLYELLPFFDLRWTENYGVSLGMLTATSVEMRGILVAMTSAIALFVFVWLLRERKLIDILALALVLGGAVGNLIDRIALGYVTDFIQVWFGNWAFPSFNVADAGISVGAALLIIDALFFSGREDEKEVESN